jgi:hypothetical protein
MPAASVWDDGSTPDVVHSPRTLVGVVSTCTKNIVEPYISIRSPGRRTPTLKASAQASTVPATTGVPSARPVAAAAAPCTTPTCSDGHTKRGSASPGSTAFAQSLAQSCAWMS